MNAQLAPTNVRLTIDKAGHIVIPKPVREELRLEPGDTLEIEKVGEQITLRRSVGRVLSRRSTAFACFTPGDLWQSPPRMRCCGRSARNATWPTLAMANDGVLRDVGWCRCSTNHVHHQACLKLLFHANPDAWQTPYQRRADHSFHWQHA
jgi:AbrB family looped-hinge helix DNA binding protein